MRQRLQIDKEAIIESVCQEDETFDFSRFSVQISETERSDAIRKLRQRAALHIEEIEGFVEVIDGRLTMLTGACEGPLTMHGTDTLGRAVTAIVCSSPLMPLGEDADTVIVIREKPGDTFEEV